MEEANRDLDFRGMGCPVELGNDGGASLDEVILLDKPAGISSFGCVARVRGYYRARLSTKKVKVGHSGTLDPFATGLLIILVGKATKRQDEYMGMDKVYEATMKLGEISSTGDPEGEIREYEGIALTKDRRQTFTATSLSDDPCQASQILMQALGKFVGRIRQTPPVFSAIKVGGRRAYDLARKGVSFEVPPREVEIFSIELLEFNYPYVKIRAHVSSGTYIRTLVEDVGKELGVGAYTTELRRTKIGEYDVGDALDLCLFEAATAQSE